MNKTIFNLFEMNLSNLPNSNCIESGQHTNSAGQKITEFRSVLKKPELDLFKMIRVIKFDSGDVNVEFLNPNISSIKIKAIENLVNVLFSFYGKDSNVTPLGAFTSVDQRSLENVIINPKDSFWIGRMWSNLDKHAVMISIDEDGLSLFIHGVPQKP